MLDELATRELCNVAITCGVRGTGAERIESLVVRLTREIRSERAVLSEVARRATCRLTREAHARMIELFDNHVTHPDLGDCEGVQAGG